MEKNKPTRPGNTDPNKQVHSEFENTVGNSFKAVRNETPANNKNEADLDDPLNQLPEYEYSVINEWDTEEEPPKMSAGGRMKVNKVVGLIGLLSIIALIGAIRLVRR
jgi:hypothetical protein